MNRTTTFFNRHFPNCASHCPQETCGFSIYRGVLVQWDEDHDERVLTVLDQMPPHILDQLIITQEHEGGICFVWKGAVPKGYQEGDSVDGEGDDWVILESRSI